MNKKHFNEIDFIRVFCAIGIIIYHFSCESSCTFKPYYEFANGNFGIPTVTVFFIVSGFVLLHNNNEIKSLKEFYLKRFKSIFPMFWLCWLFFYIINVIKVRTPFYAGNPLKILLSLIGMDGYLQQRIVTYYTVGEWFIGTLIIVYLLYPLLLKCFKKNEWITLVVLSLILLLEKIFNVQVISPGFPGIIESLLKFYIGMMLYKHIELVENKIVIIISLIYFILYTFIQINILNTILGIIYGISLFIILFNISKVFMNNEQISKLFTSISKLTYPMFLLQHQVILFVLSICDPTNVLIALLMTIISILITILGSIIVTKITKKVLSICI